MQTVQPIPWYGRVEFEEFKAGADVIRRKETVEGLLLGSFFRWVEGPPGSDDLFEVMDQLPVDLTCPQKRYHLEC